MYGKTGFKPNTVALPSLEDNTTIALNELQRSTHEGFYSPQVNRNVMFATKTTLGFNGNKEASVAGVDDFERINSIMNRG